MKQSKQNLKSVVVHHHHNRNQSFFVERNLCERFEPTAAASLVEKLEIQTKGQGMEIGI